VPPLPGGRIIHPNFQQHWAATIAGAFRSAGKLVRLGNPQGVRDWETSRTEFAVPYVVYDGPARIQSRGDGSTRGGTTTVADRILTIGSYLLVLPADSEPGKVGDIWETAECDDTPWLVGQSLVLVEVSAADIAWQRSYGCDLYQPTIRG
jgi:hypothetical protein